MHLIPIPIPWLILLPFPWESHGIPVFPIPMHTSTAEHMPCHVGPAYVIFAKRVARKTSCSDTSGMPWTRRTRSAYSRLLLDASRLLTWSAADNWSLTVTPRMQMLLTRSMPGHGAGRLADFPRLPRPLMTISFVFPLFNFKLFWAAQTPICSISWHRVLEFAAGTTR